MGQMSKTCKELNQEMVVLRGGAPFHSGASARQRQQFDRALHCLSVFYSTHSFFHFFTHSATLGESCHKLFETCLSSEAATPIESANFPFKSLSFQTHLTISIRSCGVTNDNKTFLQNKLYFMTSHYDQTLAASVTGSHVVTTCCNLSSMSAGQWPDFQLKFSEVFQVV